MGIVSRHTETILHVQELEMQVNWLENNIWKIERFHWTIHLCPISNASNYHVYQEQMDYLKGNDRSL